MSQNFLSCDRDQQLLLPADMREWLADDHLAWFVLDAVDELDLSDFVGCYRVDGQGAAAHDPAMMVALLLYAYSVGETSTRAIERRLREDVAFRVIAANRFPDHTTISRFRVRHQDSLADLFTQVLGLCARAGLVSATNLAVDGTKLAANASLSSNLTPEAIRERVDLYFEEANAVDRREDELYGDRRGDELPPRLAERNSRRQALRMAKEELDAEQAAREAEHAEVRRKYQEHIERTGRRPTGRPPCERPRRDRAKRRRNLTDLDSRVVRDKGALIQGYNAQAVVCEGQLIVAADLTNDPVDKRMLEPMADAAITQLQELGIPAKPTLLADNGYWNHRQISKLTSRANVVVATSAAYGDRNRKHGRRHGPQAERIDRLLATDEGKELYGRRKTIIEPVFAQIKHLRGLRRLSRRGLGACKAEWKLMAATHNLLKLRNATQPA
jgi:transposase